MTATEHTHATSDAAPRTGVFAGGPGTGSKEQPDPMQTVGRVAVATALATTLAAGPVAPEVFHLPEAVPIVQVLDMGADQPVDQPADHPADDHRSWRKVFKALAIALVLLLAAGGLVLGLVKGCTGSLAAPDADGDEDGHAEAALVIQCS